MAKKSSINSDKILHFIKEHPNCSSNEILAGLHLDISIATLKRSLQEMVANGFVDTKGELKGRKYEISQAFEIIRPIDVEQYFQEEIDERKIQASFNQTLIIDTLNHLSVFTNPEFEFLNGLQEKFTSNASQLTSVEYKNELERLAIDLSWKSSQIEGNTYSLLETERLLKDKETAAGKTKDEATMLLNHKDALDFIIEHPSKPPTNTLL